MATVQHVSVLTFMSSVRVGRKQMNVCRALGKNGYLCQWMFYAYRGKRLQRSMLRSHYNHRLSTFSYHTPTSYCFWISTCTSYILSGTWGLDIIISSSGSSSSSSSSRSRARHALALLLTSISCPGFRSDSVGVRHPTGNR